MSYIKKEDQLLCNSAILASDHKRQENSEIFLVNSSLVLKIAVTFV